VEKVRTRYDDLQVVETATIEVIRGAYRYLAQKWHPDKNPDNVALAEKNTKIINEAFAVLSDPQRRREHDAWIAAQRAAHVEVPVRNVDSARARGNPRPSERPREGYEGKSSQTKDRTNGKLEATVSTTSRLGFLGRIGVTSLFLFSLALCIAGLYQLVAGKLGWIKLVGFFIWGPVCAYTFIALLRPSFVSEEMHQAALKQVSAAGPVIGGLVVITGVGFVLFSLYVIATEGW